MVKLRHALTFEIKPIPPYSFSLTVRKPAGWSLFTPFEVYEKGTLWTAVHLRNTLVGVKLNSVGTVKNPEMAARIFLKDRPEKKELGDIKKTLIHTLGADDDLREFYKLARHDKILKHAVKDLYGMHSTASGDTVFPDAILSILLQMTTMKRSNEMMDCIIRRFGEAAEFDGRKVYVWPLPGKLAKFSPSYLAKACNLGYRAKHLAKLARMLSSERFPTLWELEMLKPEEAKKALLELPGIGDYSADIINPHGGFPIDVWSAEVFGKLFYGKEPENNREVIGKIKKEGLRRWGGWSWMAFFYTVQDLENLSRRLNVKLRLT